MTKENFLGTWKLISTEHRNSSDQVIYPFGQNAVGQLMYDTIGYMSVQLMQSDHPRFESSDVSKSPPTELKTTFEGRLITYFGTYEINEPEETIIHQVKYSSHPDLAGTNHKSNKGFSFFR